MVYIREAHALDGTWPMTGEGFPIVEEPIDIAERRAVAGRCDAALDLSPMPVLIDDMQDSVEGAYRGFPDRLYLVGAQGRIAFAGAPGPFGFSPDDLESAIRAELGLEDPEPSDE